MLSLLTLRQINRYLTGNALGAYKLRGILEGKCVKEHERSRYLDGDW